MACSRVNFTTYLSHFIGYAHVFTMFKFKILFLSVFSYETLSKIHLIITGLIINDINIVLYKIILINKIFYISRVCVELHIP
jgi:hypothetical protein